MYFLAGKVFSDICFSVFEVFSLVCEAALLGLGASSLGPWVVFHLHASVWAGLGARFGYLFPVFCLGVILMLVHAISLLNEVSLDGELGLE